MRRKERPRRGGVASKADARATLVTMPLAACCAPWRQWCWVCGLRSGWLARRQPLAHHQQPAPGGSPAASPAPSLRRRIRLRQVSVRRSQGRRDRRSPQHQRRKGARQRLQGQGCAYRRVSRADPRSRLHRRPAGQPHDEAGAGGRSAVRTGAVDDGSGQGSRRTLGCGDGRTRPESVDRAACRHRSGHGVCGYVVGWPGVGEMTMWIDLRGSLRGGVDIE